MHSAQVIEIFAGQDSQGLSVAERLPVEVNDEGDCRLLQSPAFAKGLARGDLVRINRTSGEFELRQRSGNLCIRVLSRGDIARLDDIITPALEKLGGQLDLETPRMLVYSIHVSCGFSAIETIFDSAMDADSTWLYGNVYDPQDGTTPLNWWLDILKPQ